MIKYYAIFVWNLKSETFCHITKTRRIFEMLEILKISSLLFVVVVVLVILAKVFVVVVVVVVVCFDEFEASEIMKN